jgi:hypothetical protein
MLASGDRTIIYRSTDGQRLEHARVRLSSAGGVADGTIVGVHGGRPLRVRHEYTCDSRWHVRNASVEVVTGERELLSLAADEDGIWRRVDGGMLDVPIFNCFDVALALTPLAVAFTLRRIALEPREAAIVNVVAVDVPSLEVRMIEHRYTRLANDGAGQRIRLENFDSGERSLIVLDGDGIVIDHEGLSSRLWPGA